LQTASSQAANVANSQSRTHTDGCKPWKVVADSKSRYACTPERRDKASSDLALCGRRQQCWKNRTVRKNLTLRGNGFLGFFLFLAKLAIIDFSSTVDILKWCFPVRLTF
jgi:hypothetical protein